MLAEFDTGGLQFVPARGAMELSKSPPRYDGSLNTTSATIPPEGSLLAIATRDR